MSQQLSLLALPCLLVTTYLVNVSCMGTCSSNYTLHVLPTFLTHNAPPLLLMLINALGAAAAVVVAYGHLYVFNTVCFDTSLVMSDLCLLYVPPGTVTTVCLANDWWQLMLR